MSAVRKTEIVEVLQDFTPDPTTDDADDCVKFRGTMFQVVQDERPVPTADEIIVSRLEWFRFRLLKTLEGAKSGTAKFGMSALRTGRELAESAGVVASATYEIAADAVRKRRTAAVSAAAAGVLALGLVAGNAALKSGAETDRVHAAIQSIKNDRSLNRAQRLEAVEIAVRSSSLSSETQEALIGEYLMRTLPTASNK